MSITVYRVNVTLYPHQNDALQPVFLDFRMENTHDDFKAVTDLLSKTNGLDLYEDVNELVDIDTNDTFADSWGLIVSAINENGTEVFGKRDQPYISVSYEIINDFRVEARFENTYPFIDTEQDEKNLPQIIRNHPLSVYAIDHDWPYREKTDYVANYYGRILEDYRYAYAIAQETEDSFSIFFTPPCIADIPDNIFD